MMSKSDEIIKKLNDITAFIEGAQQKLSEGEVINLTHLDGEVETLCQETLTLAPQEAAQVQPVMGNMISKLEELGLALKDFQSNLKNSNGL